MRRILVLLGLAACLLAAGAPPAGAHPSHWLTAYAEVQRDGTFVVDVFLDREFVPDRFGKEAPVVEIAGLPPAKDLRTESYGLMAAFAVLFDGARAAPDVLWIPPRKEEELHLRLTGKVPPGARTVVFENRTTGPWANSVHQEGEADTTLAMLDPYQPMTPVELRVVAQVQSFVPVAATGARVLGAGVLLGLAAAVVAAWLAFFLAVRRRPWFRPLVAIPASIAIAVLVWYLAMLTLRP